MKLRQLMLPSLIAAGLLLAPTARSDEVVFTDQTEALGFSGGGPGCWADFNEDGFVDLCCGGFVWMNQAGRRLEKGAQIPGSCVAADFNNDGRIDLFSYSAMRLFRNEGAGEFAEVELPELPACVSRGACWGDFNQDGFVDLFVGGYEDWGKGITYPNLLLQNERGAGFQLAWSESRYRTRGVTACDFDEDGDLDVYVSNYRLQPNQLWRNNQGKLTDVATAHGTLATSTGFGGGHSVGSIWGDFNNDGHFDIFAGNFAHRDARGNQPQSRLLLNLGPADYHFKDLGASGVFYQESYATCAAGDYDNDGNLDFFFTTVYGTASFGRKNYPVLFRNTGSNAFADQTDAAGVPQLGPTYQACWADYDNDGDLDLLSGGKLFRNQGTAKHWLKLRLRGDGKRINRSAIGAQVRIRIGDRVLTRQVEAGTGEGNQNDLTLHFGLGGHRDAVSAEIRWGQEDRQLAKHLAVDQEHTIFFTPSDQE